jgi:hypothetical protein
MNKTEDMVFYAAGDIAPWRDDPATIFRHVKPVLKQGDLAFCQLEACISDRGVRTPQATAVFDENNKPFAHQDVCYGPAIKDAGLKWDPLCPTFPFHPEARKTLMVKCIVAHKQIKRVSFLPVYLNDQAEPEVLNPQDPKFGEIVTYMEEITRSQGLKTRYTVEGIEVVINKD